jgi:protein-S-isoprenylcysteine O-methyltransferase Ste14
MSGATGLILLGVWLVWGSYWLIASFTTKRTVERGGLIGYRLVAIAFALTVLAGFRVFGLAVGSALWQTSPAIGVASDLLVAAGAAFAIWARIALGRNWSAEVTFKQEHELIESGPYALVRHPIYTGLILMTIATALSYGRAAGVAVLVGVCGALWWKARQEEEIMSRHFPAAYADYKTRVPAIVPFLL